MLRRRWVVERTSGWLMRHRRLTLDQTVQHDQLGQVSLRWIYVHNPPR